MAHDGVNVLVLDSYKHFPLYEMAERIITIARLLICENFVHMNSRSKT